MQTIIYTNKATEQDLREIAYAEEVCFSDAWSESALSSQLESEYALTVCARTENGKFLGYISGGITSPEAEIFRVATLPECRRMGVGRALLSEFIRVAHTLCCEDFFIEVRESNIPARALYASFGFSETGKRKGYYKNPKEDAILLSAHLTDNE